MRYSIFTLCSSVVLICALALVGCSSTQSKVGEGKELTDAELDRSRGVPRVVSIGRDSTLTFQKDFPVEIPIDIHISAGTSNLVTSISVSVTGTAPAVRGKDYWIDGRRHNDHQDLSPSSRSRDMRVRAMASAVLAPLELLSTLYEYSGEAVLDVNRPVYVVLSHEYVGRLESDDRLSVRLDYTSHIVDKKMLERTKPLRVEQPEPGSKIRKRNKRRLRWRDRASGSAASDLEMLVVSAPETVNEQQGFLGTQTTENAPTWTKQPVLRKGSASREFTMVRSSDHRTNTLDRLLKINQIAAFPLPDEEVKAIFGQRVSERFFVVRMAIRNEEDTPILVTTGMVKASGRAAVYTRDGDENGLEVLSLPVTITPQSWEAVYAVLERDEIDDPRSKLLRRMQFVGTLATAWGNAASWGIDALTGLGIYTGVFIPEYEKLRPDSFIAYKRNLVNFSMQEYTKVAQNSVSETRFLFFSKDSVQAIIPDTNIPAINRQSGGSGLDFEGADELNSLLNLGDRDSLGRSQVLYIEIGNLSIPFDKLENEGQKKAVDAAAKAQEDKQKLLVELVPRMNRAIGDTDAKLQETFAKLLSGVDEDVFKRTSSILLIAKRLVDRAERLAQDASQLPDVETAKALEDESGTIIGEIEFMRLQLESMYLVAQDADRSSENFNPTIWKTYSQWRSDLLDKIERATTGTELDDLIKEMQSKLATDFKL